MCLVHGLATVIGISLISIGINDDANAAVKISKKTTENIHCSDDVCTATAANAVLNVDDLSTMLANSDTTVESGKLARDIEFETALSWAGTHRLTLDSYHSIAFTDSVIVKGPGAMTIITNDGASGGDFGFFGKGHIEFQDLTSSLVINGKDYLLVKSIHGIKHHAGPRRFAFLALAKSINAINKSYSNTPIPHGPVTFEGLGNTISNLTINASTSDAISLFGTIGQVRDFGLVNINISAASSTCAGALVGQIGNQQSILGTFVTGRISGRFIVGGLACINQFGSIIRSSSSATIIGSSESEVGGLVGENITDQFGDGSVVESFSTGSVSGGDGAVVGGLIGNNFGGVLLNSYATGAAAGGINALVGGLVGSNADNPSEQSKPKITTSYSTGAVSGGAGALFGGLIGEDLAQSGNANAYWDLDTSGVSNPHQGAGNVADDPGITGLTDAQLKSGLPAGFAFTIWAHNPNINNGYPYLIANPPPK